jgi:hypothetical protein
MIVNAETGKCPDDRRGMSTDENAGFFGRLRLSSIPPMDDQGRKAD